MRCSPESDSAEGILAVVGPQAQEASQIECFRSASENKGEMTGECFGRLGEHKQDEISADQISVAREKKDAPHGKELLSPAVSCAEGA
jgi:hypothetical protein